MASKNLQNLKSMQSHQRVSAINKRTPKQEELIQHSWEEVDNIYSSIGNAIVTIGENVNIAIQSINDNTDIDKNELIVTVDGIRRDLEAFTNDLIKINSSHKEHSGIVNGEDELALCISVFNDYTILSDRLTAVLFPAMLTITEHLAESVVEEAKDLEAAEHAAEAEIEPQHNLD